MKPTFITLLFITTFAYTFSQELPMAPNMKAYYLTKSRDQRTLAWVMAGVGTGLAVGGLAVQLWEDIGWSLGDDPSPQPRKTALVVSVVGLASALGSIPVFISSGKNKRKAASLSFDMQKTPAPSITYGQLPINQIGVKLKIFL